MKSAESLAARVLAFPIACLLSAAALLAVVAIAPAAEVMPPKPLRLFNDYAQVVSTPAAGRLNRQLEAFEKATSSQVWVVIYPKMQSPSSIEDYVHRMFVAWKIGQEAKNNGVLLAVFVNDHKLRIEAGYGLEGALPDALAKRIIENEIVPRFKQGNYEAGLSAGVSAILAATKGEYKGTGRTVARKPAGLGWFIDTFIFNALFPWNLVVGFTLFSALWGLIFGRRGRRGTIYDRIGRRRYNSGWGWLGGGWGGGGGGWGGGGGGWGGGGGGGGGGFASGGGGTSGGGGASGSW